MDIIQCPICLKTNFADKTNLIKHFDVVHEAGSSVVCPLCNDTVFGGIKLYLLHLVSSHPENYLKKDPISDLDQDPTSDLEQDGSTLDLEKNQCPVCLKTDFVDKDDVVRHFDSTHGVRSSVNCRLCDDTIYGGIKLYLLHMASNHPNISPKQGTTLLKMNDSDAVDNVDDHTDTAELLASRLGRRPGRKPGRRRRRGTKRTTTKALTSEDEDNDLDSKKVKELSKDSINCFSCNEEMPVTELRAHVLDEHPEEEEEAIDHFLGKLEYQNKCEVRTNDSSKKKMETCGSSPVQCPICKVEMDPKALKSHVRKGHGRGKYDALFKKAKRKIKCPKCSKIMMQESIRRHLRVIHTPNKKKPSKKKPYRDYLKELYPSANRLVNFWIAYPQKVR